MEQSKLGIKAKMRAGAVEQVGEKTFVFATLHADKDNIVLVIPRHIKLGQLREKEESLFACVQATPTAECTFMATDEETGKVFSIPVDRKINLNVFTNWARHLIVGRVDQSELDTEAEHVSA